MMKKGTLTATRLRLALGISLLLIEVLASLFIAKANQDLNDYAMQVSRVAADAAASKGNIKNLQKIQQELLANKDTVERANDIVADSQSYQYQNQIITDINDYANRAGITVTNMDFTAANTDTPAVTPTTPSTAPAVPTGVKSTSVSVTIKNPVVYEKLLRFIKSIEQNLTKMQISRIGFSKDTSSTTGITSEVLTIEVYVR
jgi:hypothetical protein